MKNPFNHNKEEAKLALESFTMKQIAYHIYSILGQPAKQHERVVYLNMLKEKYCITDEDLEENKIYLDNIEFTGETEND